MLPGTEPTLTLAGAEGFIWIVIILASIISQIIKAARQNKQPDVLPGTPQRDVGENDAPAELRQFLESLKAQVQPPQPTVPPPVPRPVQRRAAPLPPPAPPVRVAARNTVKQVTRPAEMRPAAVSMPRATPTRTASPSKAAENQPFRIRSTGHERECLPDLQRQAIHKLLAQRSDLRSAVVLREILGPPIALRGVPQPEYK